MKEQQLQYERLPYQYENIQYFLQPKHGRESIQPECQPAAVTKQ